MEVTRAPERDLVRPYLQSAVFQMMAFVPFAF